MSDKVRSILIGAALAAIGAVGAYLTDLASGRAFGAASPFVGMVISVVVNALRKYLTDPVPPVRVGAVVLALLLFSATASAGPRCCDRPRLRLFRPAPVATPVAAPAPAPVRYAVPVTAAPAPVVAPPPVLSAPSSCPGGRCPVPR